MATITPKGDYNMAEEANTLMTKEATPKTAMFMNRPYSQEERIKKDEEELERLIKEQKSAGEVNERKKMVKKHRLLLKKEPLRNAMEIYVDTPKIKKSSFKNN
jgi:DNA polymerase III delta subunit